MTPAFENNWPETFRHAKTRSPFYREFFRGVNGVPAFTLEAFGPGGTITGGTYNLTIHLADKVSGQFADLPFSGVLNGETGLGLLNQFALADFHLLFHVRLPILPQIRASSCASPGRPVPS